MTQYASYRGDFSSGGWGSGRVASSGQWGERGRAERDVSGSGRKKAIAVPLPALRRNLLRQEALEFDRRKARGTGGLQIARLGMQSARGGTVARSRVGCGRAVSKDHPRANPDNVGQRATKTTLERTSTEYRFGSGMGTSFPGV